MARADLELAETANLACRSLEGGNGQSECQPVMFSTGRRITWQRPRTPQPASLVARLSGRCAARDRASTPCSGCASTNGPISEDGEQDGATEPAAEGRLRASVQRLSAAF